MPCGRRRSCAIHDRVPGENHVVGRERGTVVPLDAAPQMIGDRPAVARDAAVPQRRFDRREFGQQPVAVVVIEQKAAPKHREIEVDLKVSDDRAERIGIRDARDAQHAGMRPRMPRSNRGARCVDAGAAAQQQRREHREDDRAQAAARQTGAGKAAKTASIRSMPALRFSTLVANEIRKWPSPLGPYSRPARSMTPPAIMRLARSAEATGAS